MDMNGLIKFGLIGAAGFALYEYFYGGLGAGTTVAQTYPAPVGPSAPAPPPTAQFARPTAAQLVAASGGVTQMNIYQWNFYYDKLTGRGSAFNTVTFPVDGSTVMSADTYLGYLVGLGLSGTRSGFGNIIDILSGKIATSVGDEDFRQSLGGIVDDVNNSAAYIDVGPIVAASQVGVPDDNTRCFYEAAGLV